MLGGNSYLTIGAEPREVNDRARKGYFLPLNGVDLTSSFLFAQADEKSQGKTLAAQMLPEMPANKPGPSEPAVNRDGRHSDKLATL